jgi:hypothetical protein
VLSSMKRTPRSTSRRASRHWRAYAAFLARDRRGRRASSSPRFAGDVAQLGHGGLHAPGHLVVRNAASTCMSCCVVLAKRRSIAPMKSSWRRWSRAADAGGCCHGFGFIGLDDAGLMLRGQEAIAEQVTHAAMRQSPRRRFAARRSRADRATRCRGRSSSTLRRSGSRGRESRCA